MLYFNRKESNDYGIFKMLVQKEKNDRQNRLVAKLVKSVPVEPDGTIVADPEKNFLVAMKGPRGTFATSLSSMVFSWEIDDKDVDEALEDKDMIGVFLVDVLEETPEYIFFELAAMLDKNLANYIENN